MVAGCGVSGPLNLELLGSLVNLLWVCRECAPVGLSV